MAQSFGGHIGRPGDACLVVVVNGSGARAKGIEKVEIFEDVTDVESVFRAFVSGVDFGLCGASGSYCLAFGHPVDWTIEPLKKS